jgi:hypothetical protein
MCIGCPGSESAFGSSQYIKISNSDFVAIQGMNTMERLLMGDLRIPYKQILKSRIILKAGQVNYLLNHLGLGDNATFLAMKATYNSKSVNKEDNYIVWNYYDNSSQIYPMAEMMVLTGSPTNRIKQIYLTNPNTKYPVLIDVMVAVIDDEYSYYTDTINQIGMSFTNLELTNIETYVPDESIVIWDSNVPRNPLAYLTLDTINSISRTGKLLIIDDSTIGRLFLDFLSEADAIQTDSILNLVMDVTSIIIQDLDPRQDLVSPVVYFYDNVGNDPLGFTVSAIGSTYSSSYDTSGLHGFTFSAQISLTQSGITSGSYSVLTKDRLIEILIEDVIDPTHGGLTQSMSINDSNIILYDYMSLPLASIYSAGTYSFEFSISDIAGNQVNTDIIFELYVI